MCVYTEIISHQREQQKQQQKHEKQWQKQQQLVVLFRNDNAKRKYNNI